MNGTFSSPAFGLSNYPSNQDCLYRIRNPRLGPISLKFENFDVHITDFVQVSAKGKGCTNRKKKIMKGGGMPI